MRDNRIWTCMGRTVPGPFVRRCEFVHASSPLSANWRLSRQTPGSMVPIGDGSIRRQPRAMA
jgi:hypothetical protein